MDKNYLQSKGYLIKGNDTIINERVALRNTGEGIFYTSTVENKNDQKPVSFKMTKAGNNLFVFENPQHNFPKRIVYELVNSDSLQAFIDDVIDGSKKNKIFITKK